MKNVIDHIKQRIAMVKRQAEMACNYTNNYYGDQLCKSAESKRHS